jgi:CheY-like chemotaxis protein
MTDSGSHPDSHPDSHPKKRILVVDDDPAITEVIELALVSRGYDVVTATDGAEGLRRAEQEAPDLVLLDVVMPRRSGLMMLERIRQWQPGGPRVILMTGNDEPRHREFAQSRGAAAFFAKPFDIDALVEAVDAALAG